MNRRYLPWLGLIGWLIGVAVVGGIVASSDSPGYESRTERVCYRTGSAVLVTVLPDGRRIAVSDGTCTYTGPEGR